jgi:hypothetical protein
MVILMVLLYGFPSLDDLSNQMLVPVGWRGEDKKRAKRDGTMKDTREEWWMT